MLLLLPRLLPFSNNRLSDSMEVSTVNLHRHSFRGPYEKRITHPP